MKRLLTVFFLAIAVVLTSGAKKVTLVVLPDNADIKVNGSLYGQGSAVLNVKGGDFVSVELSAPGYETMNFRLYGSDNRKTVEYKLKKDTWLDATATSGIVNKYFTVKVDEKLYTLNPDGSRNTEKAWKLIHNILLNYFDEIQTTDAASGFIQTPWMYKNYVENKKTLRTRASIREAGLDDELLFQIKVSSEVANIEGRNRVEAYRETNQIMKEVETLISELQTRLGIVR